MIIAQISDTHIALDTPDSARRIRDFADTIADINVLDLQPDVIVHTGDVAHNGRKDEYDAVAEILATVSVPVYLLVGNRDKRDTMDAAYSAKGQLSATDGFIQYAVNDFPIKMIMLDTVMSDGNKGEFCETRMKNLRQLASQDLQKPTVIFTHHPPFMTMESPEPLHFESEQAMSAMRGAMENIEGLLAVFCGHVHRFETGELGKIPMLAMPCIATTLRWGDYPKAMQDRPVYQLHEFDSDGSFTTETRIVQPA